MISSFLKSKTKSLFGLCSRVGSKVIIIDLLELSNLLILCDVQNKSVIADDELTLTEIVHVLSDFEDKTY